MIIKSDKNRLRVLLLMYLFLLLNSGAIAQPNLNLTVGPDLTKGIAEITWTTDNPGISGLYIIERQVTSTPPSASWLVIATISYVDALQLNEFRDTISAPYCTLTSFTYRVRFVSISGTEDASSQQADIALSDLTSPAEVKNLNVDLSFNNTGFFPYITWDKITNDDIDYFDIVRFDILSGSWPSKGTVPAITGSFYDQSVFHPCDSSFKYVVVTYDQCGHPSAPVYEQVYVQTIKLDVSLPGQCNRSATLSWNSNNAMPGGISGYKIYRNVNGIKTEIDTVLAPGTSYVDTFNFENGISYSYSVSAYSINSTYSSSSCEVAHQYIGVPSIDTVYITQVSVVDDSYINIGCYFSPAGSVDSLILLRSDDGGVTFHAIDSLPVSGLAQQSYFNDITADVHAQSYSYRIVAIDGCGLNKESLNTSKSIWLQCTQSQTQNNMEWNRYEFWFQDVQGYEIYRILDNELSTIKLIANLDPAEVSFPDLLTDVDPSKMPCYWVVANENPGNLYLQNAISKSNTCCIIKDPVFFMPNAFYPDGINKLFRPVQKPLYVDTQSFKMTIFSRWGQQLFETTDIVNGWDGTINGQFTRSGLYAYLVTYKSLEGKEYTKRGTVLLIR